MNKTITIYELLGLVKDGKAPKKIKYGNVYYEKMNIDNYKASDFSSLYLFDYDFFKESRLNDTVEIIEDNDKLEKIKWGEKESRAGHLRADEEIEILARRTERLKKKIAELIDHINKIEEKLDE